MGRRSLINGRYELEELPIGRGGMGEVWFGRDIKLDREIAVKFVRFPDGTPDQDFIRRFVRESRITARLEHPGVPAVYDVGTHEGRPFLVMQRIRGISVADLVAEQGPLPIGWAAAIAAQVCAVLAVAHRASLVHRDLKPSNLMLEADGGVKVLDFGLAVAPNLADFSKITVTGQPIGTPAYMAPEQIQTTLSGPSTDLYALGCTLHEMLAGERLFSGSTSYDVMSKQVSGRPRPIRAIRREVPVQLERLLLQMLEKKQEDRPDSADVVYQRLLPFAVELGPLPGALNPPSAPSPVRMYAGVLSRVFSDVTAPMKVQLPPHEPAVAEPSPRFNRGDLDRARTEARQLIKQSRYGQAAQVLASVVEPATQVFGSTDEQVLRLRLELADVLFEGGDYRGAAPAYERLAADLAARDGSDAESVLHCRLRQATCNALVGETSQALRELNDLVRDESRIFGDDDHRTLELRRQVGLLQLGAGQREAAEKTLKSLLADLTQLHGQAHPTVAEVGNLLTGLSRAGR